MVEFIDIAPAAFEHPAIDTDSETRAIFHARPLVIGQLYEEALALLRAARHFVGAHPPHLDGGRDAAMIGVACLRVTTRLAEIIAWLLVRRAYAAAEISLADANSPAHRLGSHHVCLCRTDETGFENGSEFLKILVGSHALYVRVMRLDQEISAKG